MKTIIVPTDFSSISLNAVNYAVDLAVSMHANLLLLHVFQVPLTYSEAPYPAESVEILEKEADERMEQLKDELLKKVNGKIKIDGEVKIGITVSELEEYCDEQNADVVIMGTQGKSAIERTLFGSNTITAMKRLKIPVIAIPPQVKFSDIKKMGFACDLEEADDVAALATIRKWAKEFTASLHIIHVNSLDKKNYTAETLNASRSVQNMLGDLKPEYHFLNNEEVEESLDKFCQNENVDMLVIIPRRHNILDKLIHKSHSKKMIYETHVPLMAIHN